MVQRDIQIKLPDGTADAVTFQPEAEGKWPGVLYLTDIGGIRPAQRQSAQRLSGEGYFIVMPNVFYRTAAPPVMDLAGLRPHPELFMRRIGELAAPLTPEALGRDVRGYVEFLSAQAAVRDKNKLGAVGFCFSGAVAMRVAAAYPERVVACASFHGGGLYVDGTASPHLLLPHIKARLLFGHAVQDRSMPAEAISKFEAALADWGRTYESETYEAARHGWTTLDNPAYNQPQAERVYTKLTRLFADTLA